MKRPMIMVGLVLVILFASFAYFLRGLALAVLGGVAVRIGSQAGGSLTILAGVLMVGSAVCAWIFVNTVWNFKTWARAYGFVAGGLALLSVMLNFAQGATLHTEVISLTVAVCITSYSIMHGLQLRASHRRYHPVASYGHS